MREGILRGECEEGRFARQIGIENVTVSMVLGEIAGARGPQIAANPLADTKHWQSVVDQQMRGAHQAPIEKLPG